MMWLWRCVAILLGLMAVGGVAEAICEARDRVRFPPPGQMVDIGGRRLHILCKGVSAGPTVVIEQGAGGPSILWWPIQDKIAGFARVCTYDRAGYLWSDPAARLRTLQDRVADLHAVLAGGDIRPPFVLVAHSFGGPLVRLYTQTYPNEVAGLVLVDTPEEGVIFRPSYESYAGKIGLFGRGLEAAARLGLVRLAASLMKEIPDGLSPDAFWAFKALLVKPAFFRAMADDPIALSRVPEPMRRIGGFGALGDRPLVVITHAIPFPGPASVLEDGWREGQARLARLSTRGELVVATRSNHMVQSDQPDLVVDAVRRVVGMTKL